MGWGSSVGRAASLVALLVLALAAPAVGRDNPERDLKKAIAMGDKAGIVAAIGALGQENSEKAAKSILKVALAADQLNRDLTAKDTNEVFDAATEALAGMSDGRARSYIAKSLDKHRDPRVRLVMVRVLASRQDAEAEQGLIDAIVDKDPMVAGAAARSLGARKSKAAIEPLIATLETLERTRREPWQDLITALVAISGQEIELATDWLGWWKANSDTFDPHAVKGGSEIPSTVVRGAPKLFGQEILSKHAVFVLDISGSMALKDPIDESGRVGRRVEPNDPGYGQVPEERMRLYRLKQAMIAAIKDLPDDTTFTIVTFATNVKRWQPKLIRATSKNKANAVDFVTGMTPQGFTNLDTALGEAFKVEGGTAFYVFSDGVPQRGKTPQGQPDYIDRQEILDKVEQWNRLRQVKIYTIGLGEADAAFMTRLATENGGKFTAVD
jgi:hypothetical protein